MLKAKIELLPSQASNKPSQPVYAVTGHEIEILKALNFELAYAH